MNNNIPKTESDILQNLAQTVNSIHSNIQNIQKDINNLHTRLNTIEDKIDQELYQIDCNTRYVVDRFREEPFLCDPHIEAGDLIATRSTSPEPSIRHRIVKAKTGSKLTIVDEGSERVVDIADCKKVGHSPTFKYLILKDVHDPDVEVEEKSEPPKKKTKL